MFFWRCRLPEELNPRRNTNPFARRAAKSAAAPAAHLSRQQSPAERLGWDQKKPEGGCSGNALNGAHFTYRTR